MPEQQKVVSEENTRFSFATPLQFAFGDGAANAERRRLFSGVAYSGEVIQNHYYWGNVVFDLGSMSVPAKLPALVDHDRRARAGYADSSTITADGLVVAGTLLSNAAGQEVAKDSDEGFPWQMSVHINPGSIEEIKQGFSVVVNGRQLNGPLTVFRNSRVSEVSFTATGWDPNTSAVAMSQGGEPSPQGTNAMDLTQAQARIATLEAENQTLQASNSGLKTELETTKTELNKFSKEARASALNLLFSDVGREVKPDSPEYLAFAAMPQEIFDVASKSMRELAPKRTAASGIPASMFSHVADTTTAAAPAAAVDPLLANAKQRSEQFAKR